MILDSLVYVVSNRMNSLMNMMKMFLSIVSISYSFEILYIIVMTLHYMTGFGLLVLDFR